MPTLMYMRKTHMYLVGVLFAALVLLLLLVVVVAGFFLPLHQSAFLSLSAQGNERRVREAVFTRLIVRSAQDDV